MMNLSNYKDYSPEGLMKEFIKLAKAYTPEWNLQPGVYDGGSALAYLFAGMFSETLTYLNKMPYKYYLYYMNLLGAAPRNATPATGSVRFMLDEHYTGAVDIKKESRLFALTGGNGERVFFETARSITAVPSKLTHIVNVHPKKNIIEITGPKNEWTLFQPSAEKNSQINQFAIVHHAALNIKNPCKITLKLEQLSAECDREQVLKRLSDSNLAHWFYINDKGRQCPFTSVQRQGNTLVFNKQDNGAIGKRTILLESNYEYESYAVYCKLNPMETGTKIAAGKVQIGSSNVLASEETGVRPDYLYHNDIPLIPDEADYCFGKEPSVYDMLYIASDEVFCKKGAQINIEFYLKCVEKNIGEEPQGPAYDFYNKYVVEKSDYTKPAPVHTFISRILWEYWNGVGWAKLPVQGEENIFLPSEIPYKKNISFQCPDNFQKSYQNAVEAYWIRARIVEVENPFAPYAIWRLPYLEYIYLSFDYGTDSPLAEYIIADNNCERRVFEKGSKQSILFEPLPHQRPCVYLAFDLPPQGLPFSMYFKIKGLPFENRKLKFNALVSSHGNESAWLEIKMNDYTDGFDKSGIIELYIPQVLYKKKMFGMEAYWMQICGLEVQRDKRQSAFYPMIEKVFLNAAPVVQKQTIHGELHSFTEKIDGTKIIQLDHDAILECELWVNELDCITQVQIEEMQQNQENNIEIMKNSAGQMSAVWIKWREALELSEGQREYILDPLNGKVEFGAGGLLPESSGALCRASYSFGGGKIGNVDVDGISAMADSIPFINKVTNFEKLQGGVDRDNLGALEKTGAAKFLHRNRAVTAADFESMVLEQFGEVEHAKCFTGYGKEGAKEYGAVTLVIAPVDKTSAGYTLKLCSRIGDYLKDKLFAPLQHKHLFYIVPAILMYLDVTVTLTPDDYENAAEIEKTVRTLIEHNIMEKSSAKGAIGKMPSTAELLSILKKAGHIRFINDIAIEGRYFEKNRPKVISISDNTQVLYAIAINGMHTVKFI